MPEYRKMILHYHDTPIYYERSGSGVSVIVLLHGFLENSSMWREIIPHLTQNHTIINIDLPGFGKSEIIDTSHSMELMAAVISEILEVEKIETATFIGHSMGGYVALAVAEMNPDIVSRLVLLNSSPLEDSPERVLNRNRALLIINTNKDAFISMAISNLFTKQEHIQYTSQIEKLKQEAFKLNPLAIKAAIIGMRDRKNRFSVLANFKKEKIMICGEADLIVPIKKASNIAEATKTTLYKITGGHMSWTTNSHEIVKIMHFIE